MRPEDKALIAAIGRQANPEAVKDALAGGGDFHKKNANGWSALDLAALYSDHAACRKILPYMIDHPSFTKEDATSILFNIIEGGSLDILRALIAKGANLSVKNFRGDTPLLDAQRLKRTEMVKILERAGVEARKNALRGAVVLQHDLRTRKIFKPKP